MKKLLILLLVLSSFSTLACDCFKGVEENLLERETELILSHLEIPAEQLESVKMLSIKKGSGFLSVVARVVFFPAYVVSRLDKCNNICIKKNKSNIRGVAKYLVKYSTTEGILCERLIRIKGVTNYEGTDLEKVKVRDLGETCE